MSIFNWGYESLQDLSLPAHSCGQEIQLGKTPGTAAMSHSSTLAAASSHQIPISIYLVCHGLFSNT